MLDVFLTALGIKKAVAVAGLLGGAISAGVMPGVLSALGALWKRLAAGSACGSVIAGFCAEPLALYLAKPEYMTGIALGLGLFGLSFVFKVLKAWNDFDVSGALGRLVDRFTGGNSKGDNK